MSQQSRFYPLNLYPQKFRVKVKVISDDLFRCFVHYLTSEADYIGVAKVVDRYASIVMLLFAWLGI
jgi:hypothetical protein